jgi:hypothetical protein
MVAMVSIRKVRMRVYQRIVSTVLSDSVAAGSSIPQSPH